MFTHRQRSFVADVRPLSGTLQFLSVLYNVERVMEDTWYVIARESNHYEDHGHLIGYSAEPRSDVIRLYFRHTERGYVLYVREGRYFGKAIGMNRHGHYGAFAPDSANVAKFWMFEGEENQITGTELTYDEAVITLAEVDGYPVGLSRHKDTPHIYLGDHYGQGLPLHITLVERNAPYLSNPEEV